MTAVIARIQVVTKCLDCVNYLAVTDNGYCGLEPSKKMVSDPVRIPYWCRMPTLVLGETNEKKP